MTVHLAELALARDPRDAPSRALTGLMVLRTAYAIEHFGHDDFVERDLAAMMATYADQHLREKLEIVAIPGPAPAGPVGASGLPLVAADVPAAGSDTTVAPVGFVEVFVERLHNTHLVSCDQIQVDPRWRGQGIDAMLLDALERVAADRGRSTLLMNVLHRDPDLADPAQEAVSDPTGQVRVRVDSPGASFALAHGFTFAQAERHSQLDLPVPPRVLARLMDEAASASRSYRLVQWTGATPDGYLDGLGVLLGSMSTEVPLGDIDFRAEVWTPDLVQVRDRNRLIGYDAFTTVAVHEATGDLVGFTELVSPRDNRAVSYQGDTLVLPDHRGRGLGGWMKAANLTAMAGAVPDVRRVHTWNADENAAMLRINHALGFRLADIEGSWQKTLA